MKRAIYGKAPSGKRLEKVKQSPNYRNGAFQNIHHTPALKEGYSYSKVLFNFFFRKPSNVRPTAPIPSIKTDLKNLPPEQDLLVWFGHSSYYIQVKGKRFLVDPVFSNNASPIPGTNRPFKGSNLYTAADMPEIDFLLITHDHYDHLDYETLIALKPKVKQVITGLGVGEHLEYWGYPASIIIESDWDERIDLNEDITLFTTSARHFSGRSFKRNNTLWLSFVLKTPDLNLFLGGDSGYDTHFKAIGEKYGPFDLAILENGQYNLAWHYIHMLPAEVLQAAKDLGTKRLFPVHSSKFALAIHAWNEPLTQLTALSTSGDIPLLLPTIGQVVGLHDEGQTYVPWWTNQI